MTTTILGRLDEKVREALDGARSAGVALAKSAHEVVENSHPEATATAAGTSGRATLLDREACRILLTAAGLAKLDGSLEAYGLVLRLLDEARAEEHGAAIGRVEAEAQSDARTYREAVERDGETDDPEHWATLAFAAWTDDETGARAIEPLTADEARGIYVAAFLKAVGGAS